jgi:septal ring factor EnvC (AmiA/AmiB activator)
VTAQELAAIAEIRGEVNGMEKRLGRVEDRLAVVATKDDITDLRTAIDRDRESVVELRFEDLQRREQELKEQLAATSAMRRSMAPRLAKKSTVQVMLPWLLGVLGMLCTAVVAWLAT